MNTIITFYELQEEERRRLAAAAIREQCRELMESGAYRPFLRQFMEEFQAREMQLSESGRLALMQQLATEQKPQFTAYLDEVFRDLPKAEQPQHTEQPEPAPSAQTKHDEHSADISSDKLHKLRLLSSIAAENGRRLSADGPTLLVVQRDGSVWADDVSSAFLRRAVAKWRGIRYVITSGGNAVGLKYDGTLVNCGKWHLSGRWGNIREVSTFGKELNAVRADGAVITTQPFAFWKQGGRKAVSYVQTREGGLVLFEDGSVGCVDVAGVLNPYSASLQTWKDMAAVAAGPSHFVGLCRNGMVLAVGHNSKGQCNVGDWSDMIAVAACNELTAGLTADGRVLTTDSVLAKITASWRNVAAITVSIKEIVGVTNDGVLMSTARRRFEKCNPAITPLA